MGHIHTAQNQVYICCRLSSFLPEIAAHNIPAVNHRSGLFLNITLGYYWRLLEDFHSAYEK